MCVMMMADMIAATKVAALHEFDNSKIGRCRYCWPHSCLKDQALSHNVDRTFGVANNMRGCTAKEIVRNHRDMRRHDDAVRFV